MVLKFDQAAPSVVLRSYLYALASGMADGLYPRLVTPLELHQNARIVDFSIVNFSIAHEMLEFSPKNRGNGGVVLSYLVIKSWEVRGS